MEEVLTVEEWARMRELEREIRELCMQTDFPKGAAFFAQEHR